MVRGIQRRNQRGRSILSAGQVKEKDPRERARTYSAELGEERDEVSAASAFELLFEEIDVYEDVRHGIFVHHRCISIREEILFKKLKARC
jgi:hypothetical protein